MTNPNPQTFLNLLKSMATPTAATAIEKFLLQNPSVLQGDARAMVVGLIQSGRVKIGPGWQLRIVQ